MLHGAGIFTYIWVIFRANVGKYSIHGAYGIYNGHVCMYVYYRTIYIYVHNTHEIYSIWFVSAWFREFGAPQAKRSLGEDDAGAQAVPGTARRSKWAIKNTSVDGLNNNHPLWRSDGVQTIKTMGISWINDSWAIIEVFTNQLVL